MNDDGDDFLTGNDFNSLRRTGTGPVTIGGFLRRSQQTLLDSPWQVLQVNDRDPVTAKSDYYRILIILMH